jgi:ATP-dependent Lhr-like helicase
VVEQLQGAAVPASALERQVLPARLPGYRPGLLDELCASGEVVWAGAGALGSDDGWVSLYLAEGAPLLLPEPAPVELTPLATQVLDALAARGAMFFRQLSDAVGEGNDSELLLALWELVWAGQVTNDTLAPLRALVTGGSRPTTRRRSVWPGAVRIGPRPRPDRPAREGRHRRACR